MGQEAQIAVFIDYDNIEISVEDILGKNTDVDWARIFQYAAQLGRVVLRRSYADWAEAKDKQRQLLSLGVELVHVNSKRGKNAADIRIVIDALELLYSEQNVFSHVLLVSGDGDFTELVHRLRTHGKTVIGMGISGTSAEYLVNACDKFVFYDKWQGVGKFKKNNGAAPKQNPAAQKAPANESGKTVSEEAAANPFEHYANLLTKRKIRMAEGKYRPVVIYKIYDMVARGATRLTFSELRQNLEALYANGQNGATPQAAVDVAHQLFHTYCFEFDPESHERIFNRPMFFSADVKKAADLLDKCDKKIIEHLLSDLSSPDALDREAAARLLYGEIRNPKMLERVESLISGGTTKKTGE